MVEGGNEGVGNFGKSVENVRASLHPEPVRILRQLCRRVGEQAKELDVVRVQRGQVFGNCGQRREAGRVIYVVHLLGVE